MNNFIFFKREELMKNNPLKKNTTVIFEKRFTVIFQGNKEG